MRLRKPIHYFGAALILFAIGVAANFEISGAGRASGRDGAHGPAEADSALSAPGVNGFSARKEQNLDFAFYEEFLRDRSRRDDGFIADKTGQWSKGSPTLKRGASGAPDLERVADVGTLLAAPDPIHNGGLTAAGPLPTGGLIGDALFGDPSFQPPGLIPGGSGPDASQPPISEVPIPPAALLFGSAIAGLAFAMRNRKG